MIPPTRDTVEMMCGYSESREKDWNKVKERVKSYKSGNGYPKDCIMCGQNGFEVWRMFRIMNREIYFDWPWDVERSVTNKEGPRYPESFMTVYPVLKRLKDFPDSVFFMGGEGSSFPINFPFPVFSNAPRMGVNQMPWPWPHALAEDQAIYLDIALNEDALNNLHNHSYVGSKIHSRSHFHWDKRIPKATFFAACGTDLQRKMVFSIANNYPDQFEIEGNWGCHRCESWNPASNYSNGDIVRGCRNITTDPKATPVGYCDSMKPICEYKLPSHDQNRYKYVVVPLGANQGSTSSRMISMIARSGSVILYPLNPMVFTFSSRFKPWVHYVPLSYSMADIAEKVRWLQENDALARQIAHNARALGDSHLRLEDFFCYSVRALDEVGKILQGSDALKPFDARKVEFNQLDSLGFVVIKDK